MADAVDGYYVPPKLYGTLERVAAAYDAGLLTRPPGDPPPESSPAQPYLGLVLKNLTNAAPVPAVALTVGPRPAVLVTLIGNPTGGTFKISVNGRSTAAIKHNADDVAMAQALASIDVRIEDLWFGGSTVLEIDGASQTFSTYRWLIEFPKDEDPPALSVTEDLLLGEAAPIIQRTSLNVAGVPAALSDVTLAMPHHPSYTPIRAGSIVTCIQKAGSGLLVISAEPRDWPDDNDTGGYY